VSETAAANAGRDWDAASYDRISDPQYAWALEVLERLPLAGDERPSSTPAAAAGA